MLSLQVFKSGAIVECLIDIDRILLTLIGLHNKNLVWSQLDNRIEESSYFSKLIYDLCICFDLYTLLLNNNGMLLLRLIGLV